jgi:hypothetical protein
MNHPQRQFLNYLRHGDWVKVSALPEAPRVIKAHGARLDRADWQRICARVSYYQRWAGRAEEAGFVAIIGTA